MRPRDSFAVGHEPDAMPFRAIVYGVATLAIVLAASLLAMRSTIALLRRQARAADAPRSVVDHVGPVRDGPPLQPSIGHDTSPTRDLAAMRASEDRVFTSLGWTVDNATGLPAVPASVVAAVASRHATSRPTTTQEAMR